MICGVIGLIVLGAILLMVSELKRNGGAQVNANQPVAEQSGTEQLDAGQSSRGIERIYAAHEAVGQFEKYEIVLELAGTFQNPYDPDEVDLGAVFTSPSGAEWDINGFYDGERWLIRFAPDEAGAWTYRAHLVTEEGRFEYKQLGFTVEPSSRVRGGLTVPVDGDRFLQYRDGTKFLAVPVAYPWQVTEGRLDQLSEAGANIITYWNGNYDGAGNGGGREQLESFQTGPGRYDMNKAERIDEVLDWLEARHMQMNFVVWPHDSLAHKINWPATWSQSAYSRLGEAVDFYKSEEMWGYQEKLYRYMIARWGHSPSLGIWDLIVEVNGTDGHMLGSPAEADAWLKRVDDYFKAHDPYRHPTMASMAGNREDYWDYAYQTVDIADRENYYDLHYSAYAEDVQLRYKSYRKPIWIGETGNMTDRKVFHQAIWAAYSNGLAGFPTWWMEEHMDEGMLESMKYAAHFAGQMDYTEQRSPRLAVTRWGKKSKPSTVNLLQFDTYSSWLLPDWAEANKDEKGIVYPLKSSGKGSDLTIETQMRFATDAYAQGVLEGIPAEPDWSGYDALELELKVEGELGTSGASGTRGISETSGVSGTRGISETSGTLEKSEKLWKSGTETSGVNGLKAKIVLYPDGQWLEAADDQAVDVEHGKWMKLKIPLDSEMSDAYWQDGEVSKEHLQKMGRMGVKIYDLDSTADAAPVRVSLRNVRLIASNPPVQQVKLLEGFMMQGESTSYGWAISEEEVLSEQQIVFENWGRAAAEVTWYDPWKGQVVMKQTVQPDKEGQLRLQAPADYAQQDIAYMLKHLE